MSILKRSITITAMAFLGTVVGSAAAPAEADDIAGSYQLKFEQVSNNCEHPIAHPQHGSLKIEVHGSTLQVNIERTPLMVGKQTRNGNISAKSRLGHTPIQGMDGVFSVAGRITYESTLSLVMIGEYQASGKPLCTQSWN